MSRETVEELLRQEQVVSEDLRAHGIDVSRVHDMVYGPTDPRAVPILLRHLELPYAINIKDTMVRALCQREFTEAFEPLMRHFKTTDDPEYRWSLGNTLSEIATEQHVPVLLELAAEKSYGTGRQMVIVEGLGRFKDDRAIPVLLELLHDEDVDLHALLALGEYDRPDLASHVEPLVKHENETVRRTAVKVLRQWGKQVKLPKRRDPRLAGMARAFRSADDEESRWKVGNVIRSSAMRSDVPILLELAADRQYGAAREMIIRALGHFKDERALPLLLELIHEQDVQLEALQALGKYRKPELADHVMPLAKHEDREVRRAAVEVLKQWGKNVGDDR